MVRWVSSVLLVLLVGWWWIVAEDFIKGLPWWAQHGVPTSMLLLWTWLNRDYVSKLLGRDSISFAKINVPNWIGELVQIGKILIISSVFVFAALLTKHWIEEYSPSSMPLLLFVYRLLGALLASLAVVGVFLGVLEGNRIAVIKGAPILVIAALLLSESQGVKISN